MIHVINWYPQSTKVELEDDEGRKFRAVEFQGDHGPQPTYWRTLRIDEKGYALTQEPMITSDAWRCMNNFDTIKDWGVFCAEHWDILSKMRDSFVKS